MANKKEDIEKVVIEEEEVVEKPKRGRKPRKKSKAELRKILQNAEVVIVNNDGCSIGYSDNNGIEIYLQSRGDTEIVEVEDLRKMHLRKKEFFNNYWILAIDVICDDESITLKDVYDYIGIGKLYEEFENPDQDFFDDLILDCPLKDFKKIIEKMNKALVLQLFNRAVVLYKEEKFVDSIKIRAIEKAMGRPDCFMDYDTEE